MNKELLITTDLPALYGLLNSDLPDGVKLISEPPIERRGGVEWNISVNFDIKVTIDLAKIAAPVFAIWLFKRTGILNKKIYINHKQVPIDEAKAIEFVTKEIEDK